MSMDTYKEINILNNDIYQNHMKYPEKGAGGPESGSLPGFPCSPTTSMAAISNQLHTARQPCLQAWQEHIAAIQS